MNNFLVRLLQMVLPRRYWYRNYYLKSDYWRGDDNGIKWKKLKKQDWTCEKCGASALTKNGSLNWSVELHVHHLHYYDGYGSTLWREKLSDLQVLCRRCHERKHV